MSTCGKARTFATVAVLGASLGLTACFNVNQVDVTGAAPLLLDDFEDGDQVSNDRLQGWGCYPWQMDAKQPTCVTTAPGFHSERAEAFTFELGAPLDGAPDTSVGVELGLFPRVPVDLSAWATVRFDAKFQPSASASAAEDLQRGMDGTTIWVRLKCDESLDHSAGSVPGGFQVEHPVHVGVGWSSFAIPWTLFQQPDWQKILVHVRDCVANVDGLVFVSQLVDLRPDLVDGQSGTLTLDNVSLE